MSLLQKLNDLSKETKSSITVAVVFLFIVLAPFIGLWAFNTLLAAIAVKVIPYTLSTWFAMLVLMGSFGWKSSIQISVNSTVDAHVDAPVECPK